ncbi:Sin3 like paired amphipathic helix containing protein [Cryptosporidium ryanae]|uniref:Sin3 like paired amphipathic helix containing protein n=1 Tax=Cryptosporidium ryanae TaxID=515981 RepID=UPI00351A2530|nr:Sin3 like paired amphipathic helix containing protein [Cryptosporidium ryanae]
MELARDYLFRLRNKCGENTELYQEFLRIMRDFKNGTINAGIVIDQVAELFKKDMSLIAEFNNFLPEELRLQVPQNDCEYAAAFVKKVRETAPEIYNDFLALLSKYREGEKPVSEVCDMSSVLFASHPELLNEFLLFIPGLGNNCNNGEIVNSNSVNYNKTNNKLSFDSSSNEADKSEFLSYLANTVYSITTKSEPPKVVTRKASSNIPYEITVIPELDLILENQKKIISNSDVDGEKVRSGVCCSQDENLDEYLQRNMNQNYNYYYNPDDVSIWEADYRIFEEAYIAFGENNQEYFQDFLRLIYLYTRGVLTVVETLLALEFFFPMDSGDLPYEIKRMIVQREAARRKYSYFCCNFAQLDYSNCDRNGSSYLQLPKDYPIASCTGRSITDRENLNDKWVSIPQGSEDFSFKHMRKNVYEENLFKCEDERFELDMVIENNRSTINVLEPIAEEISRLPLDERKNFRLRKPPFSIIHLKAISRIYGDNGSEILELLKRTPYSCVPVILNRLRQKDEEWTHARHLMNQGVWRDIQTKNYFKSFDHRSFYFRQADKKNTNVKGFLCDMNKSYLLNRKIVDTDNMAKNTSSEMILNSENNFQIGIKNNDDDGADINDYESNNLLRYKRESNGWSLNPEFMSCMPDVDVHKEVIELISFTIYRQANGPAIGSKARNFLQRFIKALFLQSNHASSDNGLVTLKGIQVEGASFRPGVNKNVQNGVSNENVNNASSNNMNCGEKSLLTVEAYVKAVSEASNGSISFGGSGLSRGRRMTRNHLRKSNVNNNISEDSKNKSLNNSDEISKSQNIGEEIVDSEDSNVPKMSDMSVSVDDNCHNLSNSNSLENISSNEENDLNNLFKAFSSTYDCRGGLKYIWSDNCKINWYSGNLSPDWFSFTCRNDSKSENSNSNNNNSNNDYKGINASKESHDNNSDNDNSMNVDISANYSNFNVSIDTNVNVNSVTVDNEAHKDNSCDFNNTNNSIEESQVRYIMGNDHICCFLRYYQIIYERLKKAKMTIEQREQNPLPFQRWSPNGPDVPRPTYKQIIWCCFGLLSGELELSLFEDICRDAMGNDSYWLGTIDKVLQGISKVVIHIVNDLSTCRLLAMNLAYRDTIFDHYKKLEEFIGACRSLLPTVQTSFYIITWSPKNSVLTIRMRQLEDYSLTFVPFVQCSETPYESSNAVIDNIYKSSGNSVITKNEDDSDKDCKKISKSKIDFQKSGIGVEVGSDKVISSIVTGEEVAKEGVDERKGDNIVEDNKDNVNFETENRDKKTVGMNTREMDENNVDEYDDDDDDDNNRQHKHQIDMNDDENSVNIALKNLLNIKLLPPEKHQSLTNDGFTSIYYGNIDSCQLKDVNVGAAIDLTNHIELLQQILVHQLTNVSEDNMSCSIDTIKLEQFTKAENEKITKLFQNNPVSFFVCLDQTFVKPLLYYSPKMKYVAKLAASSQWLGFLPDNSTRDIGRSPSILRDSTSIRHNNDSRKVNRRGLLSNENQTDDDKGHWSEESAESNSRPVVLPTNTNGTGKRGSGRKRTRGMPNDIVTEIDDLDIRVTRRRSGNISRGAGTGTFRR